MEIERSLFSKMKT